MCVTPKHINAVRRVLAWVSCDMVSRPAGWAGDGAGAALSVRGRAWHDAGRA